MSGGRWEDEAVERSYESDDRFDSYDAEIERGLKAKREERAELRAAAIAETPVPDDVITVECSKCLSLVTTTKANYEQSIARRRSLGLSASFRCWGRDC